MLRLLFPIMLFCYMFITPFSTEDINEHRTFHYDDEVQAIDSVIAIKRPSEIILTKKNTYHVHNITEFVYLNEHHVTLQENQQSKQERFQLAVQFQSSYLSTLLI